MPSDVFAPRMTPRIPVQIVTGSPGQAETISAKSRSTAPLAAPTAPDSVPLCRTARFSRRFRRLLGSYPGSFWSLQCLPAVFPSSVPLQGKLPTWQGFDLAVGGRLVITRRGIFQLYSCWSETACRPIPLSSPFDGRASRSGITVAGYPDNITMTARNTTGGAAYHCNPPKTGNSIPIPEKRSIRLKVASVPERRPGHAGKGNGHCPSSCRAQRRPRGGVTDQGWLPILKPILVRCRHREVIYRARRCKFLIPMPGYHRDCSERDREPRKPVNRNSRVHFAMAPFTLVPTPVLGAAVPERETAP